MNQSTAGIDVGKGYWTCRWTKIARDALPTPRLALLSWWVGWSLRASCWRFVKPLAVMKHWWCRRCARLECRCILPIPTRSGPLLGPVVIRPRPTVWTPWCSLGMARSSNLLPPWPRRPTEASYRTSCAVGSSWSPSAPRRRTGCPAFTIHPPRIPYEDTSPGWTRRSECWMISTRNFTRNSWGRTWSFADRF